VGFLGTGGTRGCGVSIGAAKLMHEGIAIDPTHNRAFVTTSCDAMLEAYNLNVLVVQ
jgi:hypothetical protein